MDPWWATLIKAILLVLVLLGVFAYMTLVERKILGRMQNRIGPNRTGPMGLLQPISDAIKSIFKETIIPTQANRLVYFLAPFISITFALSAFAIIPGGPAGSFFGLNPWIIDLDVGLLYVFAVTAMGIYGIFLGGWASNSKYSLLGSLRSSAQLISYELGLSLSALTIVLIAGTVNLREIVDFNVWSLSPWLWLPLLVAFGAFVISGFAEVNRTPFDLPEAEQELVAGYMTEFSSLNWALYQMSEYVNMLTMSAFISTLFLGGWRGPAFLNNIIPGMAEWPFIWLIAKMAIFMFLFIWVRATLPRFRYDQLMRFGWIWLFEIALGAALITGAVIAFVL